MRPAAPARFRESLVERTGLKRFLDEPTRIILRTLARHPGRVLMSVIGIAAAGGLLVMGSFSLDSVNQMVDLQFNVAQRYDVMVTFAEPASASALHELRRLPGVVDAEPFRAVGVRMRCGHRQRNTSITGVQAGGSLNRVVDSSFEPLIPPPDGLILSTKLAALLGAGPGSTVSVEVLEGRRPVRELRVMALVDEYMGTNAYMDGGALHQLLGEGPSLSGAYLQADEADLDALYARLKNTPRVAGVMLKNAAIQSFNETMAEMVGMIRTVNVLFATIIAFGVVYNSARISLAERSRELATLRVIGFTRAEISYILLGELAIVTALAVPLGMAIGYGLAAALVRVYDTEMWRMPLVVAPSTYAFAAVTVVLATIGSALIVRRKLDTLDLVEVLKTRE
jgi:putative ABC transport system permease protein